MTASQRCMDYRDESSLSVFVLKCQNIAENNVVHNFDRQRTKAVYSAGFYGLVARKP